MTRTRPTVAEVIRSGLDEFLETYGSTLTPEQRRTLKDLASCRTAALGGHVLGCPECGHREGRDQNAARNIHGYRQEGGNRAIAGSTDAEIGDQGCGLMLVDEASTFASVA